MDTIELSEISELSIGDVKFGTVPSFYIKHGREQEKIKLICCGNSLTGYYSDVEVKISVSVNKNRLCYFVTAENKGESVFEPEALGLKLGINTYMPEYPKWNDGFFPTLLRCEKTHLWGYFMSPEQRTVLTFTHQPVAAWELDYNMFGDEMTADFGHRIYTANLLLLCRGPLPNRHPQNLARLYPNERKEWQIEFVLLDKNKDTVKAFEENSDIPIISADKFTVEIGETAHIYVHTKEKYMSEWESPSGKKAEGNKIICDEYGVYTVKIKTENEKEAEAKIYCRHSFDYYLKCARINAIEKPQKASTHTESWYGHFSAFLARKRYPDENLDKLAQANFDEIMPYMYDFDTGEIKIIPDRIQNTASLISLLTDAFEATGEEKYLESASKFAENLMANQSSDGAYRKINAHYTAVIYSAKSMLELALTEKSLGGKYEERYKIHYASAKKAVDDLTCRLENIGTEGEQTLEDGMLTCASLQISYFALTLPKNERQKYIDAAERILACHRCLEQEIVPDCRMHNATLRFWEAQYDVLIRGNMLSGPHGWSSWYNYAVYYLYLLTGKEEYLHKLNDGLGACMQTVDENGSLRWAFAVDPYLNLKYFEADTEIEDGYKSAKNLTEKNHTGKFTQKVFGERYIPMISGWFRAGKNSPVMGGYKDCPLFLPDGKQVKVDNQGGCCDNDVHEHFKCLEETLLKKAFAVIHSDKTFYGISCREKVRDECVEIILNEECELLNVNTFMPLTVLVNGNKFFLKKGMTEIVP